MIPKNPAPHLMRGGNRFSEKDHAQTKSQIGMMTPTLTLPRLRGRVRVGARASAAAIFRTGGPLSRALGRPSCGARRALPCSDASTRPAPPDQAYAGQAYAGPKLVLDQRAIICAWRARLIGFLLAASAIILLARRAPPGPLHRCCRAARVAHIMVALLAIGACPCRLLGSPRPIH